MAINKAVYKNQIKQNLWANDNYNIFFYNYTENKKRYRGLIDLSNRTAWNKKDRISFAEAQLILIKNKKRDNEYDENVTLDKYIQKYFSFLPDTRWAKNQQQYYQNHIYTQLGNKCIKDIRPIHLKELIKTIEKKGLSVRTCKVAIEILSTVFNDAIDNRVIDFNPCRSIKLIRPVTKKIVSNATTELREIYKAIDKVYEFDYFSRTLFLFALQGRRRAEILSLKWDDIDFDNNYYVLRKTKNNEEQKIFLPNNIKASLSKVPQISKVYVFASAVTGMPIQNTKFIVKKMKDELKNPNFGLHYLRNVIVSAMAEQGLDSIYLSGALGHNDPNTIKKYLTMNYLKSSEMASSVISGIFEKKD